MRLNHADEIVLVQCGKSLMGTHIETVRTFFGNYEVEFSDCPIITSPLRVVGSNTADIEKIQDYVMNIRNRTQATL